MKSDALFFMLFSWGCVISLTAYCFRKLFSSDSKKTGESPPGTNTSAKKSKTS